MKIEAIMHLHSIHSDGIYTPTELAQLLKDNNIEAAILSDHDTYSGLEEFKTACDRFGILTKTGIEVTCEINGFFIHLLIYDIQNFINSGTLSSLIKPVWAEHERRAQLLLQRYNDANIMDIGFEALKNEMENPGNYFIFSKVTEYHAKIANIPYHEAKEFREKHGIKKAQVVLNNLPKASELVKLASLFGAKTFIAHPYHIGPIKKMGNDLNEATNFILKFVIKPLMNFGLTGLEVFHPKNSPEKQQILHAIAKNKKLLVSGGSDWHGIEENVKINDFGVDLQTFKKIFS